MVAYHDKEWGVPLHDDRKLFEMITLEGAQAGLSWSTILHRREGYRRAFHGFDIAKVAAMTDADVERLMDDPGIIRNRAKILSTIGNAKAVKSIQHEVGSFDSYLWSFVNGKPIKNRPTSLQEVPAKTELSDRLSKDLQKRGFKFVGSTICYAFMQAVGMVDDHAADCEFGTR